MTGLKQYEKDITSQFGEDGVIEEIFKRIGASNSHLFDAGAWDGEHFSNSASLRLQGWSCILCESDEQRQFDLMKLKSEKVHIFGRVYNIDSVLELYDYPTDLDFLTIDVDGDDYYLWQDMIKYKPRVVCIEYNQTVAPGISVVQERGGTFGASSKALMDLAEEKGYVFVHATVTNMFFVLKEYKSLFPAASGIPTEWVVYGGIGYNGKRYQFGKQAHNDDRGGKHEKLICCKEIVSV